MMCCDLVSTDSTTLVNTTNGWHGDSSYSKKGPGFKFLPRPVLQGGAYSANVNTFSTCFSFQKWNYESKLQIIIIGSLSGC